MQTDVAYLSATEARHRYATGELSPVELMRTVLERAQRVATSINATTAIHAEAALAAARAAEARYRAGTQRPLEGIPVAIKEEMAVAGWPRAMGSQLWDDVPEESHPAVDRLVQAGAIPHVQTTVPEFCLIGQTWSRRFGVTRNPWNPSVTPGGSSGGSGAALAAGLAPLATGSDMGGSIRIPAALCGVYGYKPPFGRLASAPGDEIFSFAVDGPMTRTFDDLVLMQNVMAGPHPATYTGMPFQAMPADYPGVAGLRIGVSYTTGSTALCPDIRRNMEQAVHAFERAGAIIEPVELAWDGARLGDVLIEAIFGLYFEEFLAKLPAARLSEGTTYLSWLMSRYVGRRNSIMQAATLAQSLHRELQRKVWDRGLSVLLCPTVFTTAVPAGMDLSVVRRIDIGGTAVDSYLGWVGTPPFNLLSRYPALAVPTGLAANSVPTSLQIVGPPFADEAVFRVGCAHARLSGVDLYRRGGPPL